MATLLADAPAANDGELGCGDLYADVALRRGNVTARVESSYAEPPEVAALRFLEHLRTEGFDDDEAAAAANVALDDLCASRPGACGAREGSVHDLQRHVGRAAHAQSAGGATRQIDDAAAHEGTAIVDANDHRAAGPPVLDADPGAERQAAMGGGQSVGVETLAVRGAMTASIPGGRSALRGGREACSDDGGQHSK